MSALQVCIRRFSQRCNFAVGAVIGTASGLYKSALQVCLGTKFLRSAPVQPTPTLRQSTLQLCHRRFSFSATSPNLRCSRRSCSWLCNFAFGAANWLYKQVRALSPQSAPQSSLPLCSRRCNAAAVGTASRLWLLCSHRCKSAIGASSVDTTTLLSALKLSSRHRSRRWQLAHKSAPQVSAARPHSTL